MGGQAAGKSLSGCISETVRCRKLILDRAIGWGCRCATSWSDLDLIFDLAVDPEFENLVRAISPKP